jgi:transcriptional regulator with XRE-family HTH domain
MKLADYLNNYGWSQADLAREADISPQTVARALAGETLSRRNAAKIVDALDRKWQTHAKGHLTLASIRGLKVTDLRRKTPGLAKQEETADEHTE